MGATEVEFYYFISIIIIVYISKAMYHIYQEWMVAGARRGSLLFCEVAGKCTRSLT